MDEIAFSSLLLAAVAGLLVGSFLNVVIYRLPIILSRKWDEPKPADSEDPKLSLSHPPSHCPHCKGRLGIKHNIPVISYILLRGRCDFCDAAISFRYPLVEIIALLLSLLVVLRLGPTWEAVAGLGLTWALISLAFIDLETRTLPDELTLGLLWAGLLLSLSTAFTTASSAILGAAIGYLVFWMLNYLFSLVTRKQGLGHGDMKLLAALGAWFGWEALPAIVLGASLIGLLGTLPLLVTGKLKRGSEVAFGHSLCLAGWLFLMVGENPLYKL